MGAAQRLPRRAPLAAACRGSPSISPASSFSSPIIVAACEAALAAASLDPSRLEVEITESTLMQDTEDAAAKIAALRALGVRLSLDDFGTGFSSLAYLNSFPVDKVKLDRSFVVRSGAVDEDAGDRRRGRAC